MIYDSILHTIGNTPHRSTKQNGTIKRGNIRQT